MSSLDVNKENEEVVNQLNSEESPITVTETVTEVTENKPADENTKASKPDYSSMTREELVGILKQLVHLRVEEVKEDVEEVKQSFYKKLKTELEEKKKQIAELVEDVAEAIPDKDELEDSLKGLLADFKARKAAYINKLEQEKESNLLQKQHVLEQMRVLVESNEDVSAHINVFKELQHKWKTIGSVPMKDATNIWKQYNVYQEKFWDLIKINNELREYDFKKNLEAKTFLCEAAERLAAVEDVVSAFQQLQKLHTEWHEIGPVAREFRDQIWNRFKEASTVVNKKHQSHFEMLRENENEALAAKTALCEKLEAFDVKGLQSYKAWDDATQTILSFQEEWRTLGYAPKKVNQQLFERYRSACDSFFAAKNEFYKTSKNIQNENLEKKKQLCEQAELLKDSTDWKATSDKLIQLQKDWKNVGPVSKKMSDELWKRFVSACDYFFEQKGKNMSSQKSVESDNLQKKRDIIEQIKSIDLTDLAAAQSTIKSLMNDWAAVGHVPFKEKDKVYKEYRSAVDELYAKLNIDASQRRIENFKTNLKDMTGKGENKLYREREKLVRAYEHLKSEIATYENNIGFFSSNSKKGGGVIKEMERKIESLKDESKLIEEKIKLIDENL
mgnify:FL=1